MGANATPALASDGVEPVPPPELAVTEAIPPLPELDVDETGVVPDLEEPPIVIDANVDGGDLDVSVRVLSPGADEPEEAVEAASGVISDALEPDITADPVLPDAPPAAADPVDEDTFDTNVRIRVLSPGRNGSVSQGSGLANDEAAQPSPDEAPARDAEPAFALEDLAEIAEDSSQYHDDNTQYQSESIPDADPWVWDWYLALDCSGNVTSTSSEIGSPDSRDWDWNWTWDWTCGFDGASEESGDALQEGFASIASVSSSAGATGAGSGTSTTTSQQSDQQSETTGAPWLWTWTFNFCGRETTFSIEAGEDTFLEWAWDWTWAWACTSADADAPATGGEGPSGEAAETGTPSGELELPPPLEIVTDQPLLWRTLFAASPTVGPFEAPISIAPVIPLGLTLPTGPGPEQAPASGPGRPSAPAAPVPVATAPAAIDIATASPSAPRSDRARADEESRPRSVAPARAPSAAAAARPDAPRGRVVDELERLRARRRRRDRRRRADRFLRSRCPRPGAAPSGRAGAEPAHPR